jgi:hypothetical protein
MAGTSGVNPEVVCRWREDRSRDRVLIEYEMVKGTFALGMFRGRFDARSLADGRTLIVQEVLVSALVLDRSQFLVDLQEDAMAIRERIESVGRGD